MNNLGCNIENTVPEMKRGMKGNFRCHWYLDYFCCSVNQLKFWLIAKFTHLCLQDTA